MSASKFAHDSDPSAQEGASGLSALAGGLIGAAIIAFLSVQFLPDDWPLAGIILAVLIAFGSFIQFFQAMKHREVEKGFAYKFPGYSGERVPICLLLRHESSRGITEFDSTGVEFALGVAPRYLFLIQHSRGSEQSEAGGKLVAGPDGQPLFLRRDEVADVRVDAFTDVEIQNAAQLPAEEWLTNLITSKLLGASTRRIPFAAIVSVLAARPEGAEIFRIGIPTEVKGEAIQALVATVVGAASDQAQDVVLGEIAAEFGDIIGQDAADFLVGAGLLSLAGMGGSADGRKGRAMAALLAERIRQLKLS